MAVNALAVAVVSPSLLPALASDAVAADDRPETSADRVVPRARSGLSEGCGTHNTAAEPAKSGGLQTVAVLPLTA
jgi:hypothetical protein